MTESTRREFCKALGGGILVTLAVPDAEAFQESGGGNRRSFGENLPQEIGAWLHIAPDSRVTVYTGKVELGQNIRTSLTQTVAEELRVGLPAIQLVMADTALTPFDMGTFGSRTTPVMGTQLRKAAAAARELLIDLAAAKWQIDRAQIQVSDGKVTSGSRSASFGELAANQKLTRAIAASLPAAPAQDWKIAGHPAHKVNGRELVSGKHRYTPDLKRPGMLYGKVLRPAAFNATLQSFDSKGAEDISGVVVVHEGDFAGVAAPGQQVASQALAALHAEWKTAPQPSAAELFSYLKNNPAEAGPYDRRSGNELGSVASGLAAADQKLQSTYTVAYIAHAPLEPRAAVAEWDFSQQPPKLTVWTGTQRPFAVRSELAAAFQIAEDRVRVIVPDTGSAYGGKHTGEAAIEAARLAKAARKPVKLVWTREEEFTWAYFRPAGVIEVTGGVKRDGKITAWEFHNYNAGPAAIRPIYDFPNQRVEFHPTRAPLRQGSYRALAATANHFARESHIDELAHAVGVDPLQIRLQNLKDPRMRAAFEAAAERFGWGRRPSGRDRGCGIGGGFEKGGYVATCAEVSIERPSGKIKIERVVTAFDCGPVVNPDQLKNCIEGGNMMAIGGALFEAIDFENGKIRNGRFSQYRVPRFSDMPVFETVLIDRKDVAPAGAGETPLVGLAPAVGNAVFAATGTRLRSLPMKLT